MFEKYGLKDFLNAIGKYSKLIIAVMVVFALIGAGYTVMDSRTKIIQRTDTVYSEVALVYLDIPEEPIFPGQQDYFSYQNNIINAYVALVNTEPAKDYIYDKVLEKYTDEDLKKHTMDFPEAKTEPFYNHMSITALGSAPVIKIISKTTSRELSADIVKYTVEYLQEKAFTAVKFANIMQNEDGTDKIEYSSRISGTLLKSDTIQTGIVGNLSKKALLVNSVLYAILGAVLSLGLVFAYTLFNPTINRKSDFEAYGVNVIGEITNRKGRK